MSNVRVGAVFASKHVNGVIFFGYVCFVFMISELESKFACWFVCNVDVERSEKSSYHNGHKFEWSQTRCLGQATTKHARECKEAWHSIDKLTFNRRIDIPVIYLQLKRSHKSPISPALHGNQ